MDDLLLHKGKKVSFGSFQKQHSGAEKTAKLHCVWMGLD